MKRGDRIASYTELPAGRAGCAPDGGIAVGTETAVARIVLDQQREPSAHDGRERAEREIGPTPSQTLDQE
jgi:hypothetical protein